ncbi:hypothetical protein Tsubulata_009057 [Turnera subulata]|uniref:Uncharacterized protein n=1 Tax=Turnera subulata TaxID=218843 RepID=A0A9Q0G1H9_9ROSI|nr:hypothetical protein Tsubulata_009057 [Turnera subulata]
MNGLQTTSTVNNRPLPRLDGPNTSMNFSNTLGVPGRWTQMARQKLLKEGGFSRGRFSGFQGDTKVLDELASAPVEEAVRNQAPDKATSSRSS